jgi:hypothetical protein
LCAFPDFVAGAFDPAAGGVAGAGVVACANNPAALNKEIPINFFTFFLPWIYVI